MTVLSAYNVEMMFGDRLLFREVCFDIGEKECVALVGPNGTGKTTLFKLITGELEPTSGQIIKSRSARLGYMEQHACAGSRRTVYDEMLTVFEPLIRMEARLDEIAHDLQKGRGNQDALIAEQSTLQEQFERQDGMTFRIQQHVLQLDVPMDNALRMDVFKPFPQLFIPRHRLRFSRLLRLSRVLQRLRHTLGIQDQVHREIRRAVTLIDGELTNLDQTRTVQTGQYLGLGAKPFSQEAKITVIGGKDLYCK